MTPHRTIFWQIEGAWAFYVLAALASAAFLAGVSAYVWVWKKRAGTFNILPVSKSAVKKAILDALLGRRVLQGDIAAGLMHLFVFWGFLALFFGTVLLFLHDYLRSFLTGATYLIFSLALEVGGLMLLTGTLWALIRRYVQRVPRLERRLEDAVVPAWLLLVGLSGFMVEALRLAYQRPPWGKWSFVGAWVGAFFSPDAAKDLYPYLWWGHGLLSLSLIASIPFTKLFHILGAPTSIYFQGIDKPVVLDVEEGAEAFDLSDSIFFDACMRCGRCVEACPSAGAGEPFAPRDFVQAMRRALWHENFPLGDIRFLSRGEASEVDTKIWHCTTCRACLEVCPVYGAAFEAVVKQRILAVEEGTGIPKLMNQTLEKVFKYDNPWESSKKKRGDWAEGLGLTDLAKTSEQPDICYFVGCTTSFDDTAQGIARSFAKILQSAGVNFGILGKKEPCCGDIARRAGELGLFVEQMEKCLDVFDQHDVSEVVTSSPHCFHTFRNEYPEAPFKARHYSLVLRDLIARGKLRFQAGLEATATYHDPCYLGRYNRIFDEPRTILRSIPGINLVEMAHHGANSLCCGGGGGRMWQDLDGETKMSEIRIKEAQATGASILVTACPLCRIMLEDARKAAGLHEAIRVMDLNELVWQALERDIACDREEGALEGAGR